MCGISGFIDLTAATSTDLLREQVSAMATTLSHRGPDHQGTWVDSQAGVAFGHTRLAVIDLSPAGEQPMVSRCGGFVLVFNGEIYNFRALRQRLERAGCRFRGNTDSEVLLEACAEWGVERVLPELNGMFAFGLWDVRERRLVLARDRCGEKPLYYGSWRNRLVFASELRAFGACADFPRNVDRDAVELFLRHNHVPGPRSIFSDVRKLGPGEWLGIQPGKGLRNWKPATYWSPTCPPAVAVHAESDFESSVVTEVDHLVRDAVSSRMVADVPLGAFLSGGIDSSLVVALMQEVSSLPVRTFTIGFGEESHDEARFARQVADHLGTEHTEHILMPADAMDSVARMADVYDEPFADSSQLAAHLVSRSARRSVTVALSGDGGDEVFGGYDRYRWALRLARMLRWFPAGVRASCASIGTAIPPPVIDRLFSLLDPVLPGSLRVAHPADKLHKLAGLLESSSVEELYVRLLGNMSLPMRLGSAGKDTETHLYNARRPVECRDLVLWMSALDLQCYLPDDVLVKVDRASMAVGLEVRAPLLDHRLIERMRELPTRFRIREGRTKWLARRLLEKRLPTGLFERPKMGFALPIANWLRGPLREWAADRVFASAGIPHEIWPYAVVASRWQEHQRGRRNWEHFLWAVLMFESWRDRWSPAFR